MPAKRITSAVTRPGQAIRPITASMATLLPEPDSPTMQRISPASIVDVDAIDGTEAAARGAELDREVADLEKRHQRFNFGSSASRNPSPNKLNASTVMRMANPGNASTHHAR